jgi:hypothetical protein
MEDGMFRKFQLLLLCLLFTSISLLNASASNMADKLVLYLDFENPNGKDVIDRSGNNNNGTILGNVKSVEGKIGQGMLFGGTSADYIKVEDSDSLDIKDVYTAMVWVNFSQLNGDRHQTFFDKGCQETTPGGWRFLKQMAGDITWQTTRKGEWLPFASVKPAPPQEIGKWYHFAVTRDGKGTLTIYIDGEAKVTSQSADFSVVVNEDTMKIGGSTFWGDSNMVIGALDEIAVYNGRALNSDEIGSAMKGIDVLAVDRYGKLASTWGRIK